ncbi:MAG: phytanoyl-CoA dioxygenase family protein [Planctomycetota bacterium]
MPDQLTDEQLTRYRADGFVVVPDVITAGERTLLTVEYPTLIPLDRIFVGPASERVLPESLVARCRGLASSCLEVEAKLAFAQWYAKPPNEPGGAIGWHQDRRFWPDSRPTTVTTWLAIDRTDEHNGCFGFLPGSHLPGELLPHRMHGTDLPSCSDAIHGETRHAATEAGSALVYHELVAHHTAANRTDDWRRALILAWNATGT